MLKNVFNQMAEWSNLMSDSYGPMTDRNTRAISNLKCITLSVCIRQLLKRAEDEILAQLLSQSVLSLTLVVLGLNPRRFANCNLL